MRRKGRISYAMTTNLKAERKAQALRERIQKNLKQIWQDAYALKAIGREGWSEILGRTEELQTAVDGAK